MGNKRYSISNTGRILVPILAAMSLAVYWTTAYRTISWWDGSNYPLAAVCGGVTNPPGSLLLTLLGWPVSRLPLGISDILSLNLFAGLLATVTICLVWLATARLWRVIESANKQPDRSPFWIGAAMLLGCLTLAYSLSIWRFAVKFTPYILTTVFTALIFLVLLRWYSSVRQKQNWKWLFVAALLIGLDFSVHRTNALLVPGIVVWILLIDPRTLIRWRSWLAGIGGLALGLSFHLLIMPMAAAKPAINMGDPSNWSRFYDYVTLKQDGGNWLVNLFPRKGDFINVQIADYVNDFIAAFANTTGPLGFVGLLPLILGLLGLYVLLRRNWKLGVGIFALFLCTSLGAVFYFNLPEDFFRPMDRHYMPSFVLFGLLICYGAAYAAKLVASAQRPHRTKATIALLVLIAAAPLSNLLSNYLEADGSNRTFAQDFAVNILDAVDQDAILFVSGDVYWSIKYMNEAEGRRRDVTVLSFSLLNTNWYVRQIVERDNNLPLALSSEEIDSLGPTPWSDSTLTIAVKSGRESFALSDSIPLPDSAQITLPPTLSDRYVLAQDKLLFDMICQNEWHRPIYFNVPPKWLRSHLRLDGLMFQLLPIDSVHLNRELLERLLVEEFVYNGWDLESDRYDPATRWYAIQLKQAWLQLARSYLSQGETSEACRILDEMADRMPNHHIAGSENLANLQEMITTHAGCGE